MQYALNQPTAGEMDIPGTQTGLPGTYKLGAWYDTAKFPDQRYDTSGIPLASPDSNGDPRMDWGNYSFYALADQMVWRPDP